MTTYTYTTFPDPFDPQGINNKGQIVGVHSDMTGDHGFLYSGGKYTTVDDPRATFATYAVGINDKGQIVGSYFDGSGNHGLLAKPEPVHGHADAHDTVTLVGVAVAPLHAGQHFV